MKILHVSTISNTLRGFILPYAEYFRDQGFLVDGAAKGINHCARCKNSFDNVMEISWSRSPLAQRNFFKAPNELRKIVSSNNYDIVHVHTPIAAFITRLVIHNMGNKKKPKVIYTAHGFHFYKGGNRLKNFIFKNLEKIAGKWTDYLVVINKEDENSAQELKIVPSKRIIYMPGIGLDLNKYTSKNVSSKDIKDFQSEIGVDPEDNIFLMVAAFIKRKRHQDVIKAFSKLGEKNSHLVFAGFGVLEEKMKNLAQELGVQQRVHFLSFRDDVEVIMCSSDAVVLPSKQEGLPRCVMEAMSFGVPVIGSNIRGTRDLLNDNRGILVEVGDIDGYEKAMIQVINNSIEVEKMGLKGQRAIKNYDLKPLLKTHENLYKRAIK